MMIRFVDDKTEAEVTAGPFQGVQILEDMLMIGDEIVAVFMSRGVPRAWAFSCDFLQDSEHREFTTIQFGA